FALATPERPALHFTVVGEPALKMLRYQQRFTFFDKARVGTSVHYVNLSDLILDRGLDAVFEIIEREVERISPGVVVVDSFRTLMRGVGSGSKSIKKVQRFLERL